MAYNFTPPTAGQYTPVVLPNYRPAPWKYMAPYIPKPPNVWLLTDLTTVSTTQPADMTTVYRVYLGGHSYTDLTQAERDALVTAGYTVT